MAKVTIIPRPIGQLASIAGNPENDEVALFQNRNTLKAGPWKRTNLDELDMLTNDIVNLGLTNGRDLDTAILSADFGAQTILIAPLAGSPTDLAFANDSIAARGAGDIANFVASDRSVLSKPGSAANLQFAQAVDDSALFTAGTGNLQFTAATDRSIFIKPGSGVDLKFLQAFDNSLLLAVGTSDLAFIPTATRRLVGRTSTGSLTFLNLANIHDVLGILPSFTLADQSITTTTLTNVTNISAVVNANSNYIIQAMIPYDSPAAADIKASWTGPLFGVLKIWSKSHQRGTATDNEGNIYFAYSDVRVWATTGNDECVWFWGFYRTGSAAGTLQLQMAQNTLSGTTTIQRDAYIQLTEVP